MIYDQYLANVYAFSFALCRNEHMAEELTQETFFKALKNIDYFNGTCKIEVWLCQIAKNTYFSYLKKHKDLSLETQPEEASFPGLEMTFIQKSEAKELHKLIHELSDPYKEVFSLRIFGELSFLDIGEIWGKSETWARVTFYRAKQKIQEEWRRKYHD